VAAKLLQPDTAVAQAWNFGPLESRGLTTQAIVEELIALWGSGSWQHIAPGAPKAETSLLRLSWEKAEQQLQWRPTYTCQEALAEITHWFKAYQQAADMYAIGREHIHAYVQKARQRQAAWV
jgi:CDP-glucose 4,6-dehydratase